VGTAQSVCVCVREGVRVCESVFVYVCDYFCVFERGSVCEGGCERKREYNNPHSFCKPACV